MDKTLLNSIISDVAIPEILSFIHSHHAATGTLPTEAEVKAHMHANAARVVGNIDAFLATKGQAPLRQASAESATMIWSDFGGDGTVSTSRAGEVADCNESTNEGDPVTECQKAKLGI